jgi:membrane-associated protease RseP (regulator of RpoE activity)
MSLDKTESKRIVVQIALFVATFFTTTLAGTQWAYGTSVFMESYSWADFQKGLWFSIPLITILTVHEFGHYFMALYHRVKTSLPYYIPLPPIPFLPFFSFGTLGAVIRLRSKPYSTIQTFDIGIAGPLAGFVVALGFLFYGFATLPPADYVFQFHPEYEQYGADYANHVYSKDYYEIKRQAADSTGGFIDVVIGKNLMFYIAEQFVDDPSRIPNAHELMHYPLLLAVYFALFVTSLNLLPIGQLDGGHVVYGLFGFKKHRIIASTFFVGIMFYGGLGNPYINFNDPPAVVLAYTLGYIAFMYFAFTGLGLSRTNTFMYALIVIALQYVAMVVLPGYTGFSEWLILGFLLSRFIGIQHPPSEIEQQLDSKRVTLGWITLLIFVLCFVPMPLSLELVLPGQ